MKAFLRALGASLCIVLGAAPTFAAITTLNGVIAGMQAPRFIIKGATATLVAGRPASLWSLPGSVGAGAFDTTLNGVVLSSTSTIPAGAIPHVDPISGNAYLARFSASANQAGGLMLVDRLWHNGGYNDTLTTAQNTTSPTWPARDNAGSTNGDGVLLAVEVSAITGAGTPTITVSYTNSTGTAGHSATNQIATVATSAIGATYFLTLQAGDTGVRSVQSLTLNGTWTTGTINLVAYRPIAFLELPNTNVGNSVDALTGGMPQIFNGTVPWLIFIPNTTTPTLVIGSYVETQG